MNKTYKLAVASPKLCVANPAFNALQICEVIDRAEAEGANVLLCPELCITGFTCGDLFSQTDLIRGAEVALQKIIRHTQNKCVLVFAGLPVQAKGKLYDVAAAIAKGKLLGLVPRRVFSTHSSALKQFASGEALNEAVQLAGFTVPLSDGLTFCVPKADATVFVCVGTQPCEREKASRANLTVQLSASPEYPGQEDVRRNAACKNSIGGVYMVAEPGISESSTDFVYGGHCLITENGCVVAECRSFDQDLAIGEVSFVPQNTRLNDTTEMRLPPNNMRVPFLAELGTQNNLHILLDIQAQGLAARLKKTAIRRMVLGVSGGLDSTLALLVCARACDILAVSHRRILAVAMPGFGTTKSTSLNAKKLIEAVDADFKEVNIALSVLQHFKDIGHGDDVYDTAYENAQARMRTMILMDLANMENGLVIGTGDLSELALGFCTYNGDQMSMYGVNASIPKTVIRAMLNNTAETNANPLLCAALKDILKTDISPELLPAGKEGKIVQKTESLIGPYELTDFYLYWSIFKALSIKEVYTKALQIFHGVYEKDELKAWLKSFFRRFCSQQFKRSPYPEGAAVLPYSFSPRGGFVTAGDVSATLWLNAIDELA